MEGFDSAPLWDFSQPASLANLADDDFLALLQKQFTSDIGTTPVDPLPITHDGVDPSKLTNYPIPAPPPPLSEDSSPSPPSVNGESSRRQSAVYSGPGSNEGDEPLKRKASEEDFEEGPSHKAPHLASKKNPSRRKGVSQDESRLLKRKEQNRAAQRAFRERKEKHVKDLEDKVASLEARNELTQTENEHLRELLQRLQDENMTLKQSQFTFSVPRQVAAAQELQKNVATTTFSLSPPSSKGTPVSSSLDTPSNFPSDIDFGSLTPFDSATMNMVEDIPGIPDTTTSYDFGYGQYVPSKTPYKTIASNPMFMSFADPMLTDVTVANHLNKSPIQLPPSNGNGFDIGAFNTWTTQTQPQSPRPESTPSHNGSFDEMFGGNLFEPQGPVDFDVLLKSRSSSSLSPVLHGNASRAMTSSSSPSTSTNNTSPPAQSPEGTTHSTEKCPKTKAEFARHVASQGDSMFAPQPSAAADPPAKESPNIRKTLEGEHGPNGPMIVCKGATFPLTEKSEKNIEVLSAWRSITSHPQFKASNIDINELCAEFTDKARCDGTKVVLDPRGISQILEKLGGKKQP